MKSNKFALLKKRLTLHVNEAFAMYKLPKTFSGSDVMEQPVEIYRSPERLNEPRHSADITQWSRSNVSFAPTETTNATYTIYGPMSKKEATEIISRAPSR
jgi:hypothetical protein